MPVIKQFYPSVISFLIKLELWCINVICIFVRQKQYQKCAIYVNKNVNGFKVCKNIQFFPLSDEHKN